MQKNKSSSRHRLGLLQKIFQHGDRPWHGLIILLSAVVILIMLSIGGMLWVKSSGSRIAFGWSFLAPSSNPNWDPVNNKFQAWPFLFGTLLTSLFAILFALPIGVGIAIFLAELCPAWLRTPLTWMVELLAAIPSVVYGLWGIFVFLPKVVAPVGVFLGVILGPIPIVGSLFTGPIPASGASRLAASLILTIMIVPTIAAVSRDVFLAIPVSQREASKALGSTEWETIWQVLIPYGRSGILGAVILGLGRALGETMAVTMVIGNSIQGGVSLLQPGYTMASIIANEFAEAVSGLHTDSLIEIGLVLFIITLLLNILARFLVWQVARQTPQEAARMSHFAELIDRNRVMRGRQRKAANALMLALTGLLTALALIPLFWIIGYVLIQGGKNINLDFFIHLPRPLGITGGGVLSAIEGTLIVTLLAAIFAIPPGVLAAFYAARYPNTSLGVVLRFSTDVLSGIPSIVVGLFAYSAIVVPMGHYSGLAGGAALAVIMLPTIIRTTEEMLKLVPATLREASLGLGAPEWRTSLSVLFPAAASGIVTGFLLALARAAGETAPLLMTTLGNERFDIGQIVRGGVQGHKSIFTILWSIVNQPVDSLPLALWKYAQQPYPERVAQAWAVALVLMLFVLIVNISARVWIQNRARRMKG